MCKIKLQYVNILLYATVTPLLQVLKPLTRAKNRGFSEVLYLDSVHRKYLEEVSSCNIFIVKVLFKSTSAININIYGVSLTIMIIQSTHSGVMKYLYDKMIIPQFILYWLICFYYHSRAMSFRLLLQMELFSKELLEKVSSKLPVIMVFRCF